MTHPRSTAEAPPARGPHVLAPALALAAAAMVLLPGALRAQDRLDPSCTGTDPAWSPDGAWLAFVAWCGGEADLYRVRADGTGARRLTRDAAHEHTPVWWPDGSRILYSVRVPGQDSELWTVRPDGADALRLTDDDVSQTTPSISPDGRRVVYESRRDDNADLWVRDLATGRETRLTSDPEPDLYPRWSPDGSVIAFQGRRDGRYAILGVAPEGGEARVLWAPEHHAAAPAWAGDAATLVAAGSGAGVSDLFLVRLVEGVPARRLTSGDRVEFAPAVSPDGRHVAYIVREPSGWNVFVRALPDGAERRLTGIPPAAPTPP